MNERPALSRRRFLEVGAATGALVLTRSGLAAAPLVPGTRAAGELKDRIELTRNRLLSKAGVPAFTDAFVLADVAGDQGAPRRFSNFSGDLSGRFIGALATSGGPDERKRASDLAADIVRHQRPDGRFGAPELAFAPETIGTEHMALLWGNGRLLVGLLEVHAAAPKAAVLDSARRLGEFLLGVRIAASRPEAQARVAGRGALGFICLTQLIEGFVRLAAATRDDRYLAAAREMAPLLPPRGIQHAHGYLTTLRGVLALHEATGDMALRAFVVERYQALVESADQTIFGSPLEYFGGEGADVSGAERAALRETAGRDPRTEGCADADFLRLSLGLWRLTRRLEYLQRAESCLRNAFFGNQFATGDFGHHVVFAQGVKPSESVGRAWWCCTMHGYGTFADVVRGVARRDGDLVRIDLGLDADWADDRLGFGVRERNDGLDLTIGRSESLREELAIRVPDWAAEPDVRVNRAAVRSSLSEGYLIVRRQWVRGDRLELRFTPETRLVRRDGRAFDLDDVSAPASEGALFQGPRLMGAFEASDPAFFGEPWPANEILVGERVEPAMGDPPGGETGRFSRPDTYLAFAYRHDGFPGTHKVTLRPFSEQTGEAPTIVATWLRYGRSNAGRSAAS